MRRTLTLVATLALASGLLAGTSGCPGSGTAALGSGSAAGGSSAATSTPTSLLLPDLSGVVPNQRWTFALDGGALEIVYIVKQVDPGRVLYEALTVRVVDGAREVVGQGRPLDWPGVEPVVPIPGAARPFVVETLPGAPPLQLDCLPADVDGDRILCRVTRGGLPTFPGEVEVVRGGRRLRWLVRVE